MSTEPEATDANTRITPVVVMLVALLVLAAILNYIDRLAISAIAPTLKKEFVLNNTEWGWMIAAFNLVYIFSSTFGGMWIDRVGVRKGLIISTIVWSLAAAGHALATGFWSLCFWRMLLAIGEGPGAASLLKGIRRLLPPHWRDTGNALIGAGWAAGAVIAPLVVGPVAVEYGWQAGFLATAGLSLFWLPLWIIFAWRGGTKLGPQDIKLAASTDEKPQRLNYRSYALWATLLAILFTVPPTVFMNGFLSLYLSEAWQMTQAQINAQQWKPFLATDAGQLLGGISVALLFRAGWKYLSARRLLMILGLTGSLVMLKTLYATNAEDAVFWLCTSRFSFQAAYTVLVAYGIEAVAENQTALMAGIMNSVFSICNLIFNPLIGKIADTSGYGPVLFIISFTPLCGLIGWLILSHLHARQTPPPAEEPVATPSKPEPVHAD